MENATAACGVTTAGAVNGMDGVMMTRNEQIAECRQAISEGVERVGMHRDIWQNELIWWLCKAVLLLLKGAK